MSVWEFGDSLVKLAVTDSFYDSLRQTFVRAILLQNYSPIEGACLGVKMSEIKHIWPWFEGNVAFIGHHITLRSLSKVVVEGMEHETKNVGRNTGCICGCVDGWAYDLDIWKEQAWYREGWGNETTAIGVYECSKAYDILLFMIIF